MERYNELLVITMEECGELVQACSKVIRTNAKPKYFQNLKEEVGDVILMIELLKEYGYVTDDDIQKRMKEKRSKLKKWSSLYDR
jgi:NTP pyrophosphatase (non-canonical NTP hydrolase)